MASRYLPRYFCSLDEPDATRTWFLIDRRLGVPLCDENGIRYFSRPELNAFLKAAEPDE